MRPGTIDRSSPSRLRDPSKTGRKFYFYFDGKRVEALEGDTVASALYASGRRIFARSFKYHRARGLFCLSGNCPNCMMNVDGRPNVKTCTTSVREGMQVRSQNAWPSLDHDAISVLDSFSGRMSVGFYYRSFIHPKWAWPQARKIIRRITGIGKVTIEQNNQRGAWRSKGQFEECEIVNKHADIIIIGAGPAGLSAALEACKSGLRIVLLDDNMQLGGHLRFETRQFSKTEVYQETKGFELAKILENEATSKSNLEIIKEATCFGIYAGGLVAASQGKNSLKIRAKKIVICTGSYDRPLLFANNDLPGIFLATGLRKLVNLNGVSPGKKVLIVTTNELGYVLADDLIDAGIQVTAIVDARDTLTELEQHSRKLEGKITSILTSHTIIAAIGKRKVSGAAIAKIDAFGNLISGSERDIDCDVIALSAGVEPNTALLGQTGCNIRFDPEICEHVPAVIEKGMYVAGDVTGIHDDLEISILQGKIAGLQASLDLEEGILPPNSKGNLMIQPEQSLEARRNYLNSIRNSMEPLIAGYRIKKDRRFLVGATSKEKQSGKRFGCICEDVTDKDLVDAIDEGFDELETLKRYSQFSMGPCQGKMCALICSSVFASKTGQELSSFSRTTSRPPYQPVPLGLVAGPLKMPTKLTAINHKHVELGARMMDHGEWIRPHDYGSMEQEYRAIREFVGMIDVSTLGRFKVGGIDSPKFLDMVFGHNYSTLKIGRVRYAPMFTEGGILLDDGVIARLAEDEYLVTSSTTNAEFVEEYLKYWEEWWKWYNPEGGSCLEITNLTSALAAINVAGPKARDVLSSLVEDGVDLSNNAAPYMSSVRASVAGVRATLLRIGFVGEVGWEVHFPSEYGEFLWNAIAEAGEPYGIKPVGVEVMNLLRLEKKNIWLDVDTDRSSDPFASGMSWAVKMDKPDFVGKHFLARAKQRAVEQKLIGFEVKERIDIRIEDGDVIVDDKGSVIGRVTSAGYSYALKKQVGLGWVPDELSKDGTIITIKTADAVIRGEVVSGIFYDPEGRRLKS